MRPSLRSVRLRLLGLVLLAGLPTLGLVLYSGIEQRRRAEERSLEQARHLTELACVNIDHALHDAQVLLESLAQTPELRGGDDDACEQLFREVLSREAGYVPRSLRPARIASRRPGEAPGDSARAVPRRLPYSAIVFADLEGRVVASSVPLAMPVSISDRPYFQLALATHTFAFSALPVERVTQRPGMAVAYRVLGRDERVRGVLIVAVEVGWLSATVAGGLLPAGGELLVLDSRGTILTRFPAAGRYVGQAYTDVPVIHEVLTRKEGEVQAASLDGVVRLWSFRPVTVAPGNDIFVALGFAPKLIFAEADRETGFLAVAVALIVATTALALWLWAQRFILRPVDTLIRTTRRLREGHLSARAELKETGELGELGRSFDEMAEDLQIREQELRASKQTMEAVLASSPVAIMTLNRQGRVTLWTPAAERLFGWSAEEVLGREVPFAVPEQAPGPRGLGALLAAGEPFMDVECAGVHREGGRLELSVSSLPLTKPDGTVTGQVVAAADLTARRQLERQLQQSQQLEAIGRLAGGVAHDFSNLLTVIQGLSESVLDRPGLDAAARHDLEGVRQAAARGSELTGQLLAFGRRQAAQPQVVDLNALVAGMTGMLRRLIGEDIQLETRLEARLAQIEVDPAQIEQALTYLLVNAREAMPKGGTLIIETANQACADRVERRCQGGCQGTCVTLSVSDTGACMDAETLEHVFEPFFRTGERTPGKGLGLAAVHGIVQQCGGDIEVASEPGRGSTFRMFIPHLESTQTGAPEAHGARDAARSSNTVLLVEDEKGVREVARAALEKAGYRVLEASQGQEALEVAGRHEGPIALLLTDVVMPEMGGPELARQLRQSLPGIRVLYFSGYAAGQDARQAAGFDAPFLAKPFRPATLVDKVREVLEADRAGTS